MHIIMRIVVVLHNIVMVHIDSYDYCYDAYYYAYCCYYENTCYDAC